MAYDVFISYSRKDAEVADHIYEALEASGIRCFIDREGISGGADFPRVLADAILHSRLLLFLASQQSYASEFTQKELTFAVSKKGSRFIFPLIIDGSSLPESLEFLLSDINWRKLSGRYTVEKELVEEVKKRLEDPHSGETLQDRDRGIVKKYSMMGISLVAIAVIGLLSFQMYSSGKVRKARSAAQEAQTACQQWIRNAGNLLSRSDSLRDCSRPVDTFEEELQCIRNASVLLDKADSVREVFLQDVDYSHLFLQMSDASERNGISHRLDSMFGIWSRYARSNYEQYCKDPNPIYRDITLHYTEMALRIRPEEGEMLVIKNKCKI